MSDNLRERLLRDYTENYMGPIFYYCLRRTGNGFAAANLAQDIAWEVCSALQKGRVPTHFPAWVWKIVRNCYSHWAARKHRDAEYLAPADAEDLEDGLCPSEPDPLENVIAEEQAALLRRELAFIRREYREIIVAYYLRDQSVKEIAQTLSLTESTVKKRLERARNHLKEGMTMARTFGKLSYQPENIAFINNGMFGACGEPWNYISRMLCKNILLAAYRAPSTAEELALELGVALPYMEEEAECLVAATLMKKNGNRYETAFFIVSAAAQEAIYSYLREHRIAERLTRAVIRTVEYETVCKNRLSPAWHEGYQPYEDMKWALLTDETDRVRAEVLRPFNENRPRPPYALGPWGHTLRPNGGEWDILGMEIYNGEKPAFVGQHGCGAAEAEKDLPVIDFYQYKYQYRGIERKTPSMLHYADGLALLAAARGDTSTVPPAVLERLEKAGYLEKKDGAYRPTFLVMFKEKNPELPEQEREELKRLRGEAAAIAREYYLFCREQVLKEIPAFLKDDFYQIDHACGNIFEIRGVVVEGALKEGYISYGENDPRKMLGAVLKV